MQVREKVGQSRFTVFIQCLICGSGGSKSRLAKAADAEPSGQMRDEKLHAVVALSAFPSQNVQKKHKLRSAFRSCDVQKVHAVVARSTFASQNAQNTPCSDHFRKLRCLKSARRCGAKHISKSKCTKHVSWGHFWKLGCRKSGRCCGAKHICKSKCTKHTMPRPLLKVEMSKKCTPLWREAHFQVKSVKNPRVRSTFGRSDVILHGKCKGLCILSTVSKT